MGNPSHSCVASPAILDHAVLPTSQHRWTCRALTQLDGTLRFAYPDGMEGWGWWKVWPWCWLCT